MKRYHDYDGMFPASEGEGGYVEFDDVQQLARECMDLIWHAPECEFLQDIYPCTCGADAVRTKLREIVGETT